MLNKSSLLFIGLGLISLTSLCTFLYFKPKKNTKKDDVDTKKDDVDENLNIIKNKDVVLFYY